MNECFIYKHRYNRLKTVNSRTVSTGQFRLKKHLRGAGEAEVWGLCTQRVCRGQSPAEGLGAKSPRSCGINALLQHAVTVNTPSRYAANIYTIRYDTSREDRVAL